MEEKNVETVLTMGLEKGLASLNEMEPGSDEYIRLSTVIREMYKLRNEYERLNFEAFYKKEELAREKERLQHEKNYKERELALKEKEIAVDAKKASVEAEGKKATAKATLWAAIIGGGSTLFSLVFGTNWIHHITESEKENPIVSKAFALFSKIPIFGKR